MKELDLETISKARLALGNPYAHMEYLDEESWSAPQESNVESKLLNRESRSDEVGGRQELSNEPTKSSSTQRRSPRPIYEIKKLVRGVQKDLWIKKKNIMGGRSPGNPIEILDAEVALLQYGYSVEFVEGFGTEVKNGRSIEVAGELDMSCKKVLISLQFPLEQQRFTLAHELGHVVMHQKNIGLHHRDRILDGVNVCNEVIEKEADKFAVLFTMPEKLVIDRFKKRFNTSKFHVAPETVGALGFSSLAQFKNKVRTKREFSRFLVSSKDYAERYFATSLATEFKVSVESIAIRIEELGLLEFNKKNI